MEYDPVRLPTPSQSPVPLILLIGLPGSGKSTLAAKLTYECPKRRLISTDRIRAQLFGDEATQGPWQQVWWEVRQQFCQTVAQIKQQEAVAGIYDATNVVRRQRRQALALARDCGFTQIIGLWCNLPLEVCWERNQHRDRQVPEAVLLRMHRRLQGAPPDLQEGFDQLLTIKPLS